MKILLDENVPVQVAPALRAIARGHQFDHVDDIGWKGKKDKFLLPDAASRGYNAIVTKDANQLADAEETHLIRRSGMHHVRFEQDGGVRAFAHAMGSVVAAMPDVLNELGSADGQRLVHITRLENRSRHTTVDPSVDPPPYWGRR